MAYHPGMPNGDGAVPNTSGANDVQPKRRVRPEGARNRSTSIPWEEIDVLLVLGERVTDPATGRIVQNYPSTRALSERYGVAKSNIAEYSKKNRCMERRQEAAASREANMAQAVRKLRDRRDKRSMRLGIEEELDIVDSYLLAFAEALDSGKVDATNPGDLNLMMRLKRFLQGEVESRTAIHTVVSLDSLRERYERNKRVMAEDDPTLTGVEVRTEPPEEQMRGPWGPRALPPAVLIDIQESAREEDDDPRWTHDRECHD
jgi:hypothetical protein